jgi:uncharacterized protein YlaI
MYAVYDFKAGDASAAMCPHCHKPVATRYEHRTIQLARTRLRVRDVLVPVCTECDHTVAIPRQSFAQLREVGVGK